MSFSTYVSGLNGALGLAFDNNNNLYIANGGNNNIIKVDTLTPFLWVGDLNGHNFYNNSIHLIDSIF